MIDYCACAPLDSSGWPTTPNHTLDRHGPMFFCVTCSETVPVAVYNGEDDIARHVVTIVSPQGIKSMRICGPVEALPLACLDCSSCDGYSSLDDREPR